MERLIVTVIVTPTTQATVTPTTRPTVTGHTPARDDAPLRGAVTNEESRVTSVIDVAPASAGGLLLRVAG